MMSDDIRWLVGLSVTVVVAIASIGIGAFRAMSGRLDRAENRLADKIEKGDEKLGGQMLGAEKDLALAMKREHDRLHERVNRVRDEYVPRRELDDHMKRIDKTLDDIKTSQSDIISLLTRRPYDGDESSK